MSNIPKKESERAAAARLSIAFKAVITRSQVQYWTAQGYDLNDIESLTRSLRNQERLPESLKGKLAPIGAKPTPPPLTPTTKPSIGSIPIETAWIREVLLMFKLADWLPVFCAGKTADEIQETVFTAAGLRALEWDEVLGNLQEFKTLLGEFKQYLKDRPDDEDEEDEE